jgi:hypothetical protein
VFNALTYAKSPGGGNFIKAQLITEYNGQKNIRKPSTRQIPPLTAGSRMSAVMMRQMRCGIWWRRKRGRLRSGSCGGYDVTNRLRLTAVAKKLTAQALTNPTAIPVFH